LQRAHSISSQGYSFDYAEVINTTKTDGTRPAEKGSLAQVISTENRHARAFLDYRLGRLMMVETMDRMDSPPGGGRAWQQRPSELRWSLVQHRTGNFRLRGEL
jgi:hypothetical protein